MPNTQTPVSTPTMESNQLNNASRGLLLIISGPSGVGKTTITHEVERRLGAKFSVSMTTRPKTHKDIEGRDYYFVDLETFKKAEAAGDMLESAEVYPGRCYGTPKKYVEQQLADGELVILEIDVDGAIQVKEKLTEVLAIFVKPPSEEELLRRLRNRDREPEDVIQVRFKKAKSEIAAAEASGIYDHFVVNDDLATAINEATSFVQARLQQNRK